MCGSAPPPPAPAAAAPVIQAGPAPVTPTPTEGAIAAASTRAAGPTSQTVLGDTTQTPSQAKSLLGQ